MKLETDKERLNFWKKVYIASIRASNTPFNAERAANLALEDCDKIREEMEMKYES